MAREWLIDRSSTNIHGRLSVQIEYELPVIQEDELHVAALLQLGDQQLLVLADERMEEPDPHSLTPVFLRVRRFAERDGVEREDLELGAALLAFEDFTLDGIFGNGDVCVANGTSMHRGIPLPGWYADWGRGCGSGNLPGHAQG